MNSIKSEEVDIIPPSKRSKRSFTTSTCDKCRQKRILCSSGIIPCSQCILRDEICTGDIVPRVALQVKPDLLREELEEIERIKSTVVFLLRRVSDLEGKSVTTILNEIRNEMSPFITPSPTPLPPPLLRSNSLGLFTDTTSSLPYTRPELSREEKHSLVMDEYQMEMGRLYGFAGEGKDNMSLEVALRFWNNALEKFGFTDDEVSM